MAGGYRIEMTRTEETTGVIRFVGQTDEGQMVSVVIPGSQWEILGEPDELVLRIRPSG